MSFSQNKTSNSKSKQIRPTTTEHFPRFMTATSIIPNYSFSHLSPVVNRLFHLRNSPQRPWARLHPRRRTFWGFGEGNEGK